MATTEMGQVLGSGFRSRLLGLYSGMRPVCVPWGSLSITGSSKLHETCQPVRVERQGLIFKGQETLKVLACRV